QRLKYHNASQSGGLYVALASLELGRARSVLPALQDYVERYPNVPWAELTTFVMARAGDREGTCRSLEQAVPKAMIRARDNLWLPNVAVLCESALFVGARDAAAALYPELAPYSGMHAVVGYGAASYGAVDRYLGLLALVMEDW